MPIYVSPSGSDSNSGDIGSPVQSLPRAQSIAQGASDKTVILRAGTFSLSGDLYFTGSDNGETWIPYTGETAIIDGSGSHCVVVHLVDTFTMNGLTFQNMGAPGSDPIQRGTIRIEWGANQTYRWNTFINALQSAMVGWGVNNLTITDNTVNGCAGGDPFATTGAFNFAGGMTNLTISHNHMENVAGGGVVLNNGYGDPTFRNITVDRNMLINCCYNVLDQGPLYYYDTHSDGQNINWTNNYVNGYGNGSHTDQTKGFYLDWSASNTYIAGNIWISHGEWGYQVNGGQNNLFENNIWIMTGGTIWGIYQYQPPQGVNPGGMNGNEFRKNILYSADAWHDPFWTDYRQPGDAPPYVHDNLYYCAVGGSLPGPFSDSNPTVANPLFANPGAGDYSLPSNSPAFLTLGMSAFATDQGPRTNPYVTPGAPTINSFYASPSYVAASGDQTTLYWHVTGDLTSLTLNPGSIDVLALGSYTVTVTGTETLNLTAVNGLGSSELSVTVGISSPTSGGGGGGTGGGGTSGGTTPGGGPGGYPLPSATVSASAGGSQTATTSTTFGTALKVLVAIGGTPKAGVGVTFTSPLTGPGGTFDGANSVTVTTDSSGYATAPTFTANGQVGTFVVTANVLGYSGPAVFFNLTNSASGATGGTGGTGSITFVSTRAGTSNDYMRYVFTDINALVKTERYMQATLLDFALVPADSDFVRLDRGAYIKVSSDTYPNWFTGYVTNEPSPSYLGKNAAGQGVYGYKYEATSDEYILSMKPLGVVPPFLNLSMGTILKTLVNRMLPGVFDISNIDDGPIVAQYVVTPDKYFKDVFKDLCDQASYIFWGKNHHLYFKPQDDPSLGSLTFDGNSAHFTPARLSIRASTAPIINDVTVLGQLEPQTYMHEYFVGTGLQSAFPLTAGVFGADNCLLLEDTFSDNQIDTTKWVVYSGGGVVLNTAQNTFQVYNSYLNVIASGMAYDTWIQALSAVPLEGRMRFTHGEWDFLSTQQAYIGCIWTGAPTADLTGCIYGLKMNGATINPVVGGVVDTTQYVSVSSAMRYVIRTVVEFTKHVRVPNKYTYLDKNGVLQSVSSINQPDTATWQTLISEVDPTNGTLVNQWGFKNNSILNGVNDVYGVYTPIVVNNTDLTVSNISISIPICCTLETATDIGLVNGSFDAWDDTTHPSGWINPVNCIQETTWSDTDMAIRIHTGGSIEQDVSSLLRPGVTYMIQFRVMLHVPGTGTLKVQLYATPGLAPVGITLDLATDVQTYYTTITRILTVPLASIPTKTRLKISFDLTSTDYNPIWIDSMTVYSDFQHQLVGPNEMDAMDGLAPVATIVAGNSNSQTKSTFAGTPQYNPGQDQLVFFKNSVTLTSDTPPENQIVRLSYRAAGSAVARVIDRDSILTEQGLYLDDGVRSTVRTDLSPRPRTSLECELAAKAIVAENSFQHYEGTYTQYSRYFPQEPRAGMPLVFSNHPQIPYIQAEEISQVTTTALCSHGQALFQHEISFGKPDHIQRFLDKIELPIDSFQQNPASPYADPGYVDVTDVGSTFIEDVTKPYLVNWDEKYIYIDIGQDLSDDATAFEIRYTDDGWAKGPGKNLVVSQTTRPAAIPRNPRGRVFFIRQVNISNGLTSRYSACMNVSFPTVVSNAYIRDWLCETVDLHTPLAVGQDLSNNRYKIKIDAGTQVYLQEWHLTLKTPPTASPLTADILVSSDLGRTWASIFPVNGPLPNCPAGTPTKVGTQFQTRFLNRGDMLRYDCKSTDGVATGLTLDLIGRVLATGATPIGAYGVGTGSTGAPTGTHTSPGTASGGITAEYLMSEGGGTIIHDTSGLHRDGSFGNNQPSWDANPNVLDFTNTNQYVQLPDTTLSIDSNTVRDFSVEVWVKPIAASGTILTFGDSTGLSLYYDTKWHLSGGVIPFTVDSTSNVALNTWVQIVVARVNSTVTMYINATQDATLSANSSPLGLGSGSKYLGANPDTSTSNGGSPVFDLGINRYYSVGLSATAVTQNWNAAHANYGI